MENNQGVNDRRRYQRVLVDKADTSLAVVIVDHGPCEIFDMSYEGAALSQPQDKKVNTVDQPITVHLKTETDEATISATSVRVSEEIVAVNFKDISVAARIIIDRVVTDRIVGLNMKLIDASHYAQRADFSHWFHGPKDSNLYLWTNNGQLERAQMELAEATMIYEDDALFFENRNVMDGLPSLNNQQIALKILAVAQQINHELPSLKDLISLVQEHVQA